MGTVVTQLLPHWQASWRRERAGRLLPSSWLADQRPEAQEANHVWIDLLSARLALVGHPAALAAVADDDR